MLLLLQVILASIFKSAICMLKFKFWELSMLVGGKLEFLCGYNLVPALVLDFGGVSLMGRA